MCVAALLGLGLDLADDPVWIWGGRIVAAPHLGVSVMRQFVLRRNTVGLHALPLAWTLEMSREMDVLTELLNGD